MTAIFHHIYFLPWIGYFTKLEYTNYFVILDNVGFRRNHIKRVKILNSQGHEHWLCIPVGNNRGKICSEIKMPKDKKYINKILQTIQRSYGKAKFFNENIEFIKHTLNYAFKNKLLIDCNIEILLAFKKYLKLNDVKLIKASSFGNFNNRTKRIIEISKNIGINKLIMGNGNMQNIHNLELISKNGITIYKQNVLPYIPKYQQIQNKKNNSNFTNGLSIIDVLFNCGKNETTAIIKNPIFKPKEYKHIEFTK